MAVALAWPAMLLDIQSSFKYVYPMKSVSNAIRNLQVQTSCKRPQSSSIFRHSSRLEPFAYPWILWSARRIASNSWWISSWLNLRFLTWSITSSWELKVIEREFEWARVDCSGAPVSTARWHDGRYSLNTSIQRPFSLVEYFGMCSIANLVLVKIASLCVG